MFVADTCALYWWTVRPGALSAAGHKLFAGIGDKGVKICSASLWELGLKAQRGQLELGCPIREYARRLTRIRGLEIVSVDSELWVSSLELEWDHRDPVDRLVVALAARLNVPVLTRDKEISSWYPHVVLA